MSSLFSQPTSNGASPTPFNTTAAGSPYDTTPAPSTVGASGATPPTNTASSTVAKSSLAFGALVSGGASILAGYQQAAADENQATLYRQQSQLDLFNAGTQVQHNQQIAMKTISAANATAGAAGVTSAGSPALANAKTINDANIADIYARYAGQIKSNSDLYQAQLEDYAAGQAKLGGYIQAASIFGNTAAEAAAA